MARHPARFKPIESLLSCLIGLERIANAIHDPFYLRVLEYAFQQCDALRPRRRGSDVLIPESPDMKQGALTRAPTSPTSAHVKASPQQERQQYAHIVDDDLELEKVVNLTRRLNRV
jgi:hypothetical protein